jgi:hypothetical protein
VGLETEVAAGWRKLHNEEFHKLYISPNNIRVMKLRRMRWAGHVAHMGNMRNENKYSSESLKGGVLNELYVFLDFIHRLVSQKIEELKICTKYHNTRVHKIHTRVNY